MNLRLENSVSLENYISGYWHHDRCGRRLKVFIFMHDVDEDRGRPTVVAKGSHKLFHYAYKGSKQLTSLEVSRMNATWVGENYDPVPLHGKRGGGFIFDTNAL